MPNLFAYLVLYFWPVAALLMFRLMPPVRAMIWTILGGYLFLPTQTGIDLPLLPALDKELIPSLSAAVLMFFTVRREKALARRLARRAGQPLPEPVQGPPGRLFRSSQAMVFLLLLLPFAIYLTNREPLVFAIQTIPAMKPYDAFAMVLRNGVMLLPFLIGRRYLATLDAVTELLRALVLGGVIYSFLILVEVRLSPQLNQWFYGFFPHSFAQHVRNGGFRPIVFLEHGLRVSIFMAMTVVAAVALRHPRDRGRWLALALWLGFALFISKSLGAFFIALLIAPIVVLARPRTQLLAAGLIGAVVLVYPMLRGSGAIPTASILDVAASISPDRAESLQYRFDNEDRLLAKANLKPLLGWGMWGRNHIFDENGYKTSVTDGVWVIIMGEAGWGGYLLEFGLLILPLLVLLSRRRDMPDPRIAGLALILAANLLDMLPNSSLTPLSWLIAGTLTRLLSEMAPRRTEGAADARRRRSRPERVGAPARRAAARLSRSTPGP